MTVTQMDSNHLSEIRSSVINSQQVRDAMAQTESPLSAARRLFDRILGVHRAIVITVVGFLLSLVFPLIFPMGMHMDEESLYNLKAALSETGRLPGDSSKDGKKRRPVILLPTHKSHVDYLSISLFFAQKGLPMPLIVAGDNLNIPIVGSILHAGGAMFIRRSFAGDKLYSAVFNETMIQLLRNNHVVGCFIEGGRSRSGKLLTPKAGFLKSVVDSVLDGHVEDALLVPIAFSYGRVVEARSMVQEMSGGTKKKEALWDTLSSMINLVRTTFWGAACYGSIEISVAKAFSVREHLRSREAKAQEQPPVPDLETPGFDLDAVQQPGTASYKLKSFDRKMSLVFDPNQADKKTRVQLALSLGFRSLHECNRIGVILGTALVGTVLLMHKDRGLKISDLVEKVEWLRKEIVSRGGRVQSTKTVEETVAEVVDKIMWGSGRARLVKKHKSVVMTGLFTPMETLELSTFRNNLIHFFVQDAVVAIALHAALVRNGSAPETTSNEFWTRTAALSDVSQAAQFLSVLLKHEFIYKPINNGPANTPLTNAVRKPEGDGTTTTTAFTDNFKSITAYMKDRNVLEPVSAETVKVGDKGKQLFEFLCGLLFPFIDAYYLTLLGAYVFINEEAEMNNLVSSIQELGENMYMNNLMDHYDAIAKDTVNNALSAFADIGLIGVDTIEGSRTKMIKFKVPKTDVLQTIELLHSFRKGKGKFGSETPHLIADAIEVGRSLKQ